MKAMMVMRVMLLDAVEKELTGEVRR
jgi:hypothetical protein